MSYSFTFLISKKLTFVKNKIINIINKNMYNDYKRTIFFKHF